MATTNQKETKQARPGAIQFTYEDKDYTLEFTRAAIKHMENKGFMLADIEERPMTIIPDFFAGAFLAHHPNTPRKLVDEIFNNMTDKGDLMEALINLYMATHESLLADGSDETKNIQWTVA